MATSRLSLRKDLSCPVCYDVFSDPVILSCGHSFCRTCIHQSWTHSPGRECPLCRQSSSRGLLPDLALRNTCETYLQQKKEEGSGSQAGFCSRHSEKLSLFCLDDEELVCGQCVSEGHQNHSFCSISKAATPRKEILHYHLSALEMKLQIFKDVKDLSEEVASHVQSQSQQTEIQIKEEFEKLHQFLRAEEEARISALREEEDEKSQMVRRKLEDLEEQIEEISSRIRETEEQLKDDALILQNFKRTEERPQYTRPDPQPISGALIDVAKHLGNLKYRVWEKMKGLCLYFPVVLDPNSASSSLSVSASLRSVSVSSEDPRLPHNPERISAYSGVLGSEGLSSGTHSWVVQVGDSEDWVVGVAEESANRKGACPAVPENGFYCIWRRGDEIFAGLGGSGEKLATPLALRRICVILNWEKRQVTFSNSENNKALYTFKHKSRRKVFPYFSTNSNQPLKIRPFQISVSARM